MRKLSQKELLCEGPIRDWKPGKGQLRKGIGSFAKGLAKKGAQTVGAAGKALNIRIISGNRLAINKEDLMTTG